MGYELEKAPLLLWERFLKADFFFELDPIAQESVMRRVVELYMQQQKPRGSIRSFIEKIRVCAETGKTLTATGS